MGKKIIWVRLILAAFVGAVAITIFCLSADEAVQSDAKSDIFSDTLARLFSALFNLSADKADRLGYICAVIVRKTAHFAEYAALGFFTAALCSTFDTRPLFSFLMSQGACILYAVSDEVHQYFVPGRSCQVGDMVLDSLGAAAGIGFLLLILYLYRRKKESKSRA